MRAAVAARAEERFKPAIVASARASWDVNVEASEENERRRVVADIALSDLLGDAELFASVEAARSDDRNGAAARQIELVHAAMLPNQVPADLRHRIIELETRVESRFAQHRGVVDGRELSDNELNGVLRRSRDVGERKAAWSAAKTVGAAVAADVRELARLRNQVARRLGRRDWFALSVEASEMSEQRLFETLGACDTATAEPFARWKAATDAELARRFGCAVAELRPWHYADPFFQEVPTAGGVDLDPLLAQSDVVELAARTFAGLGLDTEQILARSDLYPRAAKCQHAFCLDVDRAGDVRVLANVVPDVYWADTMLHELGHATYDLGYDEALPFLLRDCHLTVTEGIAILMGGLVTDSAWLREIAEVEPGALGRLGDDLDAARRADRLLFTRWVLVMTSFERALYADPDGDHDGTWWDLVRRYQLLTPPDEPPRDAWASKIHIGVSPVYYHTYLFGQLVAAQLRSTLRERVGGLLGLPAAGEFLRREVFRHGESLRWDRLIEQATGEPLSPAHFAAELG